MDLAINSLMPTRHVARFLGRSPIGSGAQIGMRHAPFGSPAISGNQCPLPLRYWLGEQPTIFLKAREKLAPLANPTACATSSMEFCRLRSRSFATWIRTFDTYSNGVELVEDLKALQK